MNEYQRREAIIQRLSRFCPIDGAELVTREKLFESRSVYSQRISSYWWTVKVCPNGHGSMDVGPAEGGSGDPHAIFELDEKLFEEGYEFGPTETPNNA